MLHASSMKLLDGKIPATQCAIRICSAQKNTGPRNLGPSQQTKSNWFFIPWNWKFVERSVGMKGRVPILLLEVRSKKLK